MESEKKALYNSFRMGWLEDPSLDVEPWQVEDYRSLSLDTLLQRLRLQEIDLDRPAFTALAEEQDTPETLTDHLIGDADVDQVSYDQIYLLLFELWRRLLPEKMSLSVFCDELDYQIYLYDTGQIQNPLLIQDLLANLGVILDEYVDGGASPKEIFSTISRNCANDIESFLYDLISDQIDQHNESYAGELLDQFQVYFSDNKWFDFLQAKLFASTDPSAASRILPMIILVAAEGDDLDFNLELLSFLINSGEARDFISLAKKTFRLLKSEDDFNDLLSLCSDFYQRLDQDESDEAVKKIIKNRANREKKRDLTVNLQDNDISELNKILSANLNRTP